MEGRKEEGRDKERERKGGRGEEGSGVGDRDERGVELMEVERVEGWWRGGEEY